MTLPHTSLPMRAGVCSPESRRVSSGTAQIYYEVYGCGPAVLLVPGALDNVLHWSFNIPHFVHAGYRVIAVNLRGHFLSPCANDDAHFKFHADDLAAVLANEGIAAVAILASSFGGFGALRLALQRPSLVKALVLSGSTAGVYSERLFEGNRAAVDGFAKQISLAQSPQADFTLVTRPHAFLYRQLSQLGSDSTGYSCPLAALLSMNDRSSWLTHPVLAAFTTPTLLVGGDAETVLRQGFQRELVTLIPGARLSDWMDSGHVPFWEDPARYNAIVSEFLAPYLPASR
jgi:pimeloyl-ACP methyl ester carboxylesterase